MSNDLSWVGSAHAKTAGVLMGIILIIGAATMYVVKTGGGGSGIPEPTPPSSYVVPRGAERCSSSACLKTALRKGTDTIVMAPGSYGNGSSYFSDTSCSSIYAASVGDVRFTSGIVLGRSRVCKGGVIRGVDFDVSKTAATFDNAEIYTRGLGGKNWQILDDTFEGNWVIPYGLNAFNPAGLVAQRLVFTDFVGDALRASDNTTRPYGSSAPAIRTIADINANGVVSGTTLTAAINATQTTIPVADGTSAQGAYGANIITIDNEQMLITAGEGTNTLTVTRGYDGTAPAVHASGAPVHTPGWSDGTGEAGLWIGEPVANPVERIEVQNVSWSGIESVTNSWNTTFENLNIDMSSSWPASETGFYMEHYTYYDTIEDFDITGSADGINGEWDDGVSGDGAARNDTIENGTISADGAEAGLSTIGIYFGEGSDRNTISDVTFIGQNVAAVGANANIDDPTIKGCTYDQESRAPELSTEPFQE